MEASCQSYTLRKSRKHETLARPLWRIYKENVLSSDSGKCLRSLVGRGKEFVGFDSPAANLMFYKRKCKSQMRPRICQYRQYGRRAYDSSVQPL